MGRPRKNKSMHVLIPGEKPLEGFRDEQEPIRPVQEFKTLPEQIAKSKICVKNWYVPELREKYKNHDRVKRIDLMFPFAKIKAKGVTTQQLLIDTPKNELEIEVCTMKAIILKKLGYKYCWVDDESTLFDALSQLGET